MHLKSGDPEKLLRLQDAKDEGDVAYLLEALRDARHRYMAANLLGELKAQEAITPLITLLHAGDRVARSSAADALANIGATEAIPALIERTREEAEVVPRTWAISALGRLGDDRALVPLCELLHDPNGVIRGSAAQALGRLGHPAAIEPLRASAARENWYGRRVLRKAIRQILKHQMELERSRTGEDPPT